MKRRTVKRRPKCWSLAQACAHCPSAARVWIALLDLAAERGSSVLTPTREQLATATGIRKHDTISTALTTLERALWLDRVHVPRVGADGKRKTLLRLILRRTPRKTGHTVHRAVYAEKRGKGIPRKTGHDFPYGKGAYTATPLSLSGGASSTPNDEHPATRIERERLAEIRAKRESGTPAEALP